MNDLLKQIDDAVPDKIVIYGSLPPDARDLDILARPAEEVALSHALQRLGFERRGHSWARFQDGSVDVVDVTPAQGWALPPEEERGLFEESLPIADHQHVARPAPHHTLLIASLRLARSGTLDEKRRKRVEDALREEPAAWTIAAGHAEAWRAAAALRLLRRVCDEGGGDAPLRERFEALATATRGKGGRLGVGARTARRMVRRRRGRVIALSGLDGAGKSTQASALVASLEKLGYESVAVWTRLAQDPALNRVAIPIKRLLGRRRAESGEKPSGAAVAATGSPTSASFERGPLVTFAWSHFVAFANARAHRRAVIPHLRRGRIVVCDRYVLDSHVHLRRKYPALRSVRSQAALVRLLSPRPLRSYLLYIDADESTRRKDDVYTTDQLRRHAELYLEIYPRYGTRLVDGTRRPDDIAAEIASEVWEALRS